jgi:hypothetical protein
MCWMFLLRAEDFSCILDILYGVPGISKLQFDQIFSADFSSILVIKILDPDWEPDWYPAYNAGSGSGINGSGSGINGSGSGINESGSETLALTDRKF